MRTITKLIPLIAASGLAAACGAGGTETTLDDEVAFATFNLEADDGNVDPDEASLEAFEAEDPEAFAEEEPFEEEPAVDAEVASLGTEVDRYEILLLWGQRKLAPGTPATDWSGAISTNVGGLRVLRTIRFEDGDYVLERTSMQSVELVSHTTAHNDGLRLRLIVPKKPAAAVIPELTIALGSHSVTIPHAALRLLLRAKKVDDLGNGVVLLAHRETPCAKGMAAGFWKRLVGRGGIFGGKVVNAKGKRIGRLAGIWGTRLDGKQRFYGVYFQDGLPAGIVRGTYKALPGVDGGIFRGHFVTKGKEHKGVLMGYFHGAEVGGKGTFVGVYWDKCMGAGDVEPGTVDSSAAPDDDSDLCSADGVCVEEPALDCDGDTCADSTDAE